VSHVIKANIELKISGGKLVFFLGFIIIKGGRLVFGVRNMITTSLERRGSQ
jgi:hypothetical protein